MINIKSENQPTKNILHYKKKNNAVNLKINLSLVTENNLQGLCEVIGKIINTLGGTHLINIDYLPPCLLKAYSKQPNIKFNKSSKITLRKLTKCKNCYIHKHCFGVPTTLINILKPKIEPVTNKPNEIVFEITNVCNHNCLMCFAQSKTTTKYEPSVAKLSTVMREMKSLGIRTIRFTGGEPLLRRDIFKILELAKKNNFYTILNTNSTLLTTDRMQILEKFVDNVLTSIHGYNQITESRITNNKSLFKQKLKNIYKLTHSKIPIVRVGSVMTHDLIDNHQKYFKMLKTLGVRNWELYRPMLTSQSIKAHPNFNISVNEIKKCVNFLYEINLAGINAKIANAIPFCIIDNRKKARLTLIGAGADDGHSRLIYDARGYFKPSYFLNINLGNTVKEALEHRLFKKIRSSKNLPKNCKNCSFLLHCMGGSRFLAFQSYKNYFKPDPLAIHSMI